MPLALNSSEASRNKNKDHHMIEDQKPVLMPACPVVSLYDARIGAVLRVKELCGDPGVCHRLREMGFCEYTEICKLSQNGALICRMPSGTRMMLSNRLAKNILVESIDTIDRRTLPSPKL